MKETGQAGARSRALGRLAGPVRGDDARGWDTIERDAIAGASDGLTRRALAESDAGLGRPAAAMLAEIRESLGTPKGR